MANNQPICDMTFMATLVQIATSQGFTVVSPDMADAVSANKASGIALIPSNMAMAAVTSMQVTFLGPSSY